MQQRRGDGDPDAILCLGRCRFHGDGYTVERETTLDRTRLKVELLANACQIALRDIEQLAALRAE